VAYSVGGVVFEREVGDCEGLRIGGGAGGGAGGGGAPPPPAERARLARRLAAVK
jgi:hypothetical protein